MQVGLSCCLPELLQRYFGITILHTQEIVHKSDRGKTEGDFVFHMFVLYHILLWSYESYWVLEGMGCFHSTCPTKVFTYYDRQDSLRGCGVGGEDPAMPGIFQHRLVGDSVWFYVSFKYFFRVLRKVLSFFVWLDLCASFLLMLMSFLARCSSQQAFTECQPIVVCSVLLQAFPEWA